jgi:hypothetical protein
MVGMVQHDADLLAAVAADQVAGSYGCLQRVRDQAQRPVTAVVSGRVVDLLEMDEVNRQDFEWVSVPDACRLLGAEAHHPRPDD